MADINKPTISKFYQQTDIFIAGGVVAVIVMLIIPLPYFLLDIMLALNLMGGIIILLSVMYIRATTDFTVFPSLLLIMTIFGLALNVSSTRLILLNGPAFNVQIIKAFGDFVVAGNYVVGFIIFLILIAVQFIVITKGATRIAEVAARFSLDAMPAKQMSIEAELNSGLITQDEARKKQVLLKAETDFYGQMDGASKFIQGNVKVNLIITLVNIIGGLIIGNIRGEGFASTLKTYTLLTVGDGLVTQIPALLISTATGIIVTRAVSDGGLGMDLARQLTSQPKAIFIASAFILFAALLPGFPKIPLILLGLATSAVGYYIMQMKKEETQKLKTVEQKKIDEEKKKPASMKNLLQVDSLELEIGYNLIPLVDVEQGGDLLERITMIRRQTALELGLMVPPIRIRDNMRLSPDEYFILIKGVEIAKGKIKVEKYLAMDPTGKADKIKGEETKEPAFNLPAIWINEKDREHAEMAGYTVVDPPSIVATHLTEIIKTYGYEIMGRQEVQQILDNVKEINPVIVEEVLKISSIGTIQKILQNLLKERISIRDMNTILEAIADYGDKIKNVDILTEYVRSSLKRQITHAFIDEDKKISVFTVDPNLENILAESMQDTGEGTVSGLSPDLINKMYENTKFLLEKVKLNGNSIIFVTAANVRSFLHDILEKAASNIVVLSYNELESNVKIKNLGILGI